MYKPVYVLMRTVSVHRALTILSLGMFVFCLFALGRIFLGYQQQEELAAQARQIYYQQVVTNRETLEDIRIEAAAKDVSVPEIRPAFRGLLDVNTDIVGWLNIAGTSVDDPIVQAQDNDYYLDRNYKKEASRSGSIFMDYRNTIMANDMNTILYGHRMKNGSMFGALKAYGDRYFFDNHRTFRYDTLYKSYNVEIFSFYYTTTDFNYIETAFSDDADYLSFLHSVQNKSIHKTDIVLNEPEPILTLSTCDYTLDAVEGRLVIHGVLRERSIH
ncbi:class B sortase [Paenibacillus sp. WQ 127069]|uniref:Class B sortase n=1 Tax=Paenibacillus baimaensis TaxID=2982185 RepID=A0ABT2ULI9_9BACL|nr:class B sortase [Paenibacillus sp. WQ 127069]MCU6795442.1 class B sortase [Paenibacillus sp. WQ 127069]